MKIYDMRWNIENSYKDKNYEIKTSSKNHAYRYLLFVLSHLMMNLQELAKKPPTRYTRKRDAYDLRNTNRNKIRGKKPA